MTIFTKTLTSGSLTINAEDGVTQVSVQADATTGTFSVIGSGTFHGAPSEAVTITAGGGWEAQASSPQSPIAGVTITWLAGSVKVSIAGA